MERVPVDLSVENRFVYALPEGPVRIIGVGSDNLHAEFVRTGNMINIRAEVVRGVRRMTDPHPHPLIHRLLKDAVYCTNTRTYFFRKNNIDIAESLVDTPEATYHTFRDILYQMDTIPGGSTVCVVRDQNITPELAGDMEYNFQIDPRIYSSTYTYLPRGVSGTPIGKSQGVQIVEIEGNEYNMS